MTTLAANKARAYELGEIGEHPVAAAARIFEGCAVGLTAGTARKLVAADKFLGFALQEADNTAGAAGAINVRVRRKGMVEASVAGASNLSVGLPVYMSDDDDFTLTVTANSKVGFVARHVSGATCVVYFDADLANYA